MKSNSVCNHMSDKHNWMTPKEESIFSITGMIADRIGRQEVLLSLNHHRYNFRKQQIHLAQISPVETMSKVKRNFPILEISQLFFLR